MLRQLAAVKRHYEQVAPRMAGLPMCHPDLEIEVSVEGWCGFETTDGFGAKGLLAGVITPWCINAVLLPMAWPLSWPHRTGAENELRLPAGNYVMLVNAQGFLSLSLMAEPRQLEDQQAARVFIKEALTLLNTPVQQPKAPEAASGAGLQAVLDTPVSRRGILGGH